MKLRLRDYPFESPSQQNVMTCCRKSATMGWVDFANEDHCKEEIWIVDEEGGRFYSARSRGDSKTPENGYSGMRCACGNRTKFLLLPRLGGDLHHVYNSLNGLVLKNLLINWSYCLIALMILASHRNPLSIY